MSQSQDIAVRTASFLGELPGARYYLEKWFANDKLTNYLPVCKTSAITSDSVVFYAQSRPAVGDKAFVYLPQIGVVRGVISRTIGQVATMSIDMPEAHWNRWISTILWFARGNATPHRTEMRAFPRFSPEAKAGAFESTAGTSYNHNVVDLSPAGVLVKSGAKPRIGGTVRFGAVAGEVVRHTADGFAAHFSVIQNPATLECAMNLTHADGSPARALVVMAHTAETRREQAAAQANTANQNKPVAECVAI